MFTVRITFDAGPVVYYSDTEPDVEAIKECLIYFWLVKLGRVKYGST